MHLRRSSYPGYPVEAQGKVAAVVWDNGVVSNPACSGEWTSCAAAYPNIPLYGSFPVYNQASSIIVYGWRTNGSQPIVALGGAVTNELDTHWQPSEDEINMFRGVLSTFFPPPGTLDPSWVQFSVTFPPLSNGGEPTRLRLTDGSVAYPPDEGPAPGFPSPSIIFQNVTVFYSPVGSGPAETIGNGAAYPTYVSSQPAQASTELPNATSSAASQANAPAMNGHRPSATMVVLAVVVPVVALAVVALAVSWSLRYRRLVGPSAAFKAVPAVPIDEMRRPSRPVAVKY